MALKMTPNVSYLSQTKQKYVVSLFYSLISGGVGQCLWRWGFSVHYGRESCREACKTVATAQIWVCSFNTFGLYCINSLLYL